MVSHCAINQDFPLLHALCLEPPIYLVPNFLSAAQCAAIVQSAFGSLPPAEAEDYHSAAAATAVTADHRPRTSCSVDTCDEWCGKIQRQVQLLTQQSPLQMERPTVTRYCAGQQYVAHHDAFPPGDELAGPECGGNRICTVLVYLNEVPHGGCTRFHHARFRGKTQGADGLSVKPQAGSAVVFFPSDAETGLYDPTAMHSAEMAVDEKWVAQTWVRQGPPGRMATMAGRAEATAAAAAASSRLLATGTCSSTRSPEPEAAAGAGTWRFFPD